MAFFTLMADNSYAKMNMYREVGDLIDGSKPNVLIIVSTDKFMTRPAGDSGGGVSDNEGDDPALQSRFYMVKDVLSGFTEPGVLNATKEIMNYGLMSYNQATYYPYYTADCFASLENNEENPTMYAYKYDLRNMFSRLMDSFSPSSALACHNGPYHGAPGGSCGGGVGGGGGSGPGVCTAVPDRLETNFKGNSFVDAGTGTTYYHFDYWQAVFAQYPIDQATAGKLWVPIDVSDSLTPATSPTVNPAATWDEATVIMQYMDLQANGGLAVDKGTSGGIPVADIFRNADGDFTNDAYEYFSNTIIPNDLNSNSGCFTKNYIIFVSDGFGNSADFTTAATDATALFNLQAGAAGVDTPVKTFVIGVIDPTAAGMGGMASNLNEIARSGGTDATDPFYGLERTAIPLDDGDNYAFFVTDRAEIKEAFLNITAAIAAGDFVTGSPTATSSGSTFVTNDVGILASAEYPSWKGHLRGVDLINDEFWWDAGVALILPAADTNNLPKAIVSPGMPTSPPPDFLNVGGINYTYTEIALYCETAATDCNSSKLTAYEYIGNTATFGGTNYTYKGAFYLKPWNSRNVYTSRLDGTLLELTTANWLEINGLAGWGAIQADAEDYIEFARGGLDEDGDGIADSRLWFRGDMSNMVPISIGTPIKPKDGLTGRVTFQDEFAHRDSVVYSGTNDGTLYAFDFETGEELFSYIPPDLLKNLKTFHEAAMVSNDPISNSGQQPNPADHIYGISSSPKVNDVQFADGTWHTVLVMGEGPGGKNYFALDITHPKGASDYTGAAADFTGAPFTGAGTKANRYDMTIAPFKVLWHTQNIAVYTPTLGETWSLPAFGRVDNAGTYEWVVFAGSGYDDNAYGDSKGEIYHIINVENGALLRDDIEMDGVGTSVQYGLLADSVTVSKGASEVMASYQVDLKGRLWHTNTTSPTKALWDKTSLDLAGKFVPSVDDPIYFSPAMRDFDKSLGNALNLLVFGSNAFEDPDSDGKSTNLFFTIVNPATPAMTDAITLDFNIDNVRGTLIDKTGVQIDIGSGVGVSESLSNAKLVASPVLLENRDSGNIEAIFLVFDPPPANQLGCSFGESYLLVFNLGPASTYTGGGASSTFDISAGSAMANVKAGNAEYVVSVGSGRVSGVSVAGGGSHAVVGQAGRGRGSTSGFNISGGSTWNPIGDVKKLFWLEK